MTHPLARDLRKLETTEKVGAVGAGDDAIVSCYVEMFEADAAVEIAEDHGFDIGHTHGVDGPVDERFFSFDGPET